MEKACLAEGFGQESVERSGVRQGQEMGVVVVTRNRMSLKNQEPVRTAGRGCKELTKAQEETGKEEGSTGLQLGMHQLELVWLMAHRREAD